MKALSIRQPWTWAILAAGKDVENRSSNIVGGHRGTLLVHAGLHLADREAFGDVEGLSSVSMPMLGTPRAGVAAQLGGIVGVVDVAGVHHAYACAGNCSVWAHPAGVHIRLENPRPLRRMVQCPGRLGLFTPVDEVLAEVARWMP